MAKRIRSTAEHRSAATGSRAAGEPAAMVHTSLYLPGAVHDALREVAFKERCKVHDLVMEGIEAALRQRGYPSIEALKAGKQKR
jgi:hypothetical protein